MLDERLVLHADIVERPARDRPRLETRNDDGPAGASVTLLIARGCRFRPIELSAVLYGEPGCEFVHLCELSATRRPTAFTVQYQPDDLATELLDAPPRSVDLQLGRNAGSHNQYRAIAVARYCGSLREEQG